MGCNYTCRRRFSAAFKATCLSFGQSFTADVVQPLFLASAAVPQQDPASSAAEHLAQVSTYLLFALGPSGLSLQATTSTLYVPLGIAVACNDMCMQHSRWITVCFHKALSAVLD